MTKPQERSVAVVQHDLKTKLSSQASVVGSAAAEPRWTEYAKPRPGIVVKAAQEQDVVETVKYCVENDIPFLAQGGSHSWSTTLEKMNGNGIVIDLRGLNQIAIKGHEITMGGGVLVSEAVDTVASAGLQMTTGNCNGVGMAGAVLHGSLGRLIGRYGLGIDNIVSVNLVTATGELLTVTPTNPDPDLWWAIRGAGANFGIATSITMTVYPQVNDGKAWIGMLIYSSDKVEQVAEVISNTKFSEAMALHMYYAAPPPDFQPAVVINLWYSGSAKEGREAWKALFDIGPMVEDMAEVPYKDINGGADFFCVKGYRITGYGGCLKSLEPGTFREIWDTWHAYIKSNPGAEMTTIMVECYSLDATRKHSSDSSAFPHRDANFFALALPWHTDPKLDSTADEFGQKLRELWMVTSGFEKRKVYVNFAHGDETLEEVYGDSLPRLRQIKQKWDPEGRFSFFFGIR